MISCGSESNNNGTIIVGVDPTYPPFCYLAGQDGSEVVGFDMAIMKEIALASNKEIVLKMVPLTMAIYTIESGDIDVAMPVLTINEERMEKVEFSSPSFWDAAVALVRKNDMSFSNTMTKEEIGATKIMGTPRGTSAEPITHSITDDEHIVKFDTFDETVQALLDSEVDAVIIDRVSADAFVSQYGNENLKVLSIEFDTIYYGFAVKKGNTQLLREINNALKRLLDSGEYVRFVEEYISGYSVD